MTAGTEYVERDRSEYEEPANPKVITDTGGYERVYHFYDNEDMRFYLHQLAVIAKGADPHAVFSGEVQVHHENKIPWDNSLNNLRYVSPDFHRSIHARELGEHSPKERYDDEQPPYFPEQARERADEIAENTTLTVYQADAIVGHTCGYSKHDLSQMFTINESAIAKRLNTVFEEFRLAENTVLLAEQVTGESDD